MLRDRNPTQFMRQVDLEDPHTHELVSGEWRRGDVLTPFDPTSNPRGMIGPKNVRNYLMDFYNTRGRVAWQDLAVGE